MGAGILPATIRNGKLWFLFGKENQYEKSAPGFSDFGGGVENDETPLETAAREGGEELTGFLGSDADVRHLLTKYGTFDVDYKSDGYGIYRVHIFPMEYDLKLPFYYNNNQRFLQERLDPKIIKDSKIFEKQQIKWICVDDFVKMKQKKEFRSFYQNIIELILAQRSEIDAFIRKSLKKSILKGKSNKKGGKRGTRRKRGTRGTRGTRRSTNVY